MSDGKRIPASVRVVTWLFIFEGILISVGFFVGVAHSFIRMDEGFWAVVTLTVGFGLLRLRSSSRTWGLVLTYATLAVVPLGVAWILADPSHVLVRMYGMSLETTSQPVRLGVSAAVFLVALLQNRVLARPDVRELFREPVA
ncbi:MAG: hypothetical protein M1337_07105 [Actinobacteria bacterium]|nr:hypothetical protein [Actinomycetota bacterium]